MLDAADRATDRELEKIRKRLEEMYAQAEKEIHAKTEEYFQKYYKMDSKKISEVYAGKLSVKDYRAWQEQKVFVGRNWRAIERDIAKRLTDVDVAAMAYVNGELPKIYASNYSSVARYFNGLGMGFRFDLVDENTVKYLATTDKTLLPYKTVNGKKAERWHTQKVNAEVTQGILQGESMQKIAKRLETNVGMTAEGSAMRNAQVAVGSAQNKGRVDMLYAAEKKGVISKKRWTALHDGRTRDAHTELDGVEVDLHKDFENAFGSISYPKDPDAHPSNVYGCRCRLVFHVMGVKNQETGEYTDLSGIQTFRDPNKKKRTRTTTPRKPKAAVAGAVATKTYNNAISNDIGEKKYAQYRAKLDECQNDDVKAVYEAFQDNLGVIDSHARGGAFHSRGGLNWNANKDLKGSDERKPMSTFFHESGHGNDWFLGQKTGARSGMFSTSWENGRYSQTIKDEVNSWVDRVSATFEADFNKHKADIPWLKLNGYLTESKERWLTNYATNHGVTLQDVLNGKHGMSESTVAMWMPQYDKNKAYKAVGDEMKAVLNSDGGSYKVHSLSDIVGGVTLNKANAYWGHKVSYWYSHDPAVEAFAEMSEAYVTGPESLETLRKYLPNSVACFDEMMKYARGLL